MVFRRAPPDKCFFVTAATAQTRWGFSQGRTESIPPALNGGTHSVRPILVADTIRRDRILMNFKLLAVGVLGLLGCARCGRGMLNRGRRAFRLNRRALLDNGRTLLGRRPFFGCRTFFGHGALLGGRTLLPGRRLAFLCFGLFLLQGGIAFLLRSGIALLRLGLFRLQRLVAFFLRRGVTLLRLGLLVLQGLVAFLLRRGVPRPWPGPVLGAKPGHVPAGRIARPV